MRVKDIMSSPACTVRADAPLGDAVALLEERSITAAPVVDDGVLVGIITRADIVRAFTRSDAELASEILDDILRRTFWAEPGSVTVTVTDGRVALAGQVETEADTEMLPLFVSRVPGVVAVDADLRARTHAA